MSSCRPVKSGADCRWRPTLMKRLERLRRLRQAALRRAAVARRNRKDTAAFDATAE